MRIDRLIVQFVNAGEKLFTAIVAIGHIFS